MTILETAQEFGGGGHANAAGATISSSVAELREPVLAKLRSEMKRQLG